MSLADSDDLSIGQRFRRARSRIFEYGTIGLAIQALLVYLFLYIPIIVVVALSFNNSRYAVVWEGFTTEWYRALLAGETVARVNPAAAFNSLLYSIEIAIVTVVVSTVFGTMLAFALDRYEFPGKGLFLGLVYMPIIIPSIVMGISLLLFFNMIGMSLGVHTAMIAHISFGISFVAVVVAARLRSFDRTLEEAAQDLGANELETFRYVTFPAIKPGVIAGSLLAFAMSFDDFVVTFFVIGNENTLPIFFFSMVRQGISPGVNVVATLILVVTMFLVALAQWIEGPTW
ncbi:ABC transporter permease [Natronorubrum aibiense]|uniref:ABC transporter permease subunit n=1 Tax=Natronorubrum aibiense TaxID=348826 RepID=A0A5P9P967_9EURY|nr:ABC transporter permease [Natronorubrum aibiense]QFU84537.1 ABC transporter permease subunit [Natronorubrum aibiense]